MTNEWKKVTLGSVANFKTGKLDSNAAVEGGKYPFFTCSPETLQIDSYSFDAEAVLLAGNNANGIFPIKYYQGRFDAYQRTYVVTPKNHSTLNTRFLYYAGKTLLGNLRDYSIGSATKFLTLTILNNLTFDLPPLPEQRAIAHILGSLDDKIELNRRMNATLEATARALFQSWFVDFDPVHARARGEQPAGMDAATAALFPSRFVDSPLGPIPEGWRVGRLDDLVVLQRGFDLPSDQRTPGPYPILAASGPSGTHFEYRVKGPGVTTGRSGVLGKVFFVHEDYWPLNTSLWVKEFRASRPLHAYHLLSGLDFGAFNAGSAVPTLNRNHIHDLPTVIPPMEVINNFEELAMPLFLYKKRNIEESQSLAETRDILLPKLLSGEIGVDLANS